MSGERLLQMKVARGQNKSQGQTTYSRFSHKTEAHSHPFHTQYRRAKIEGFDFDQTVHIELNSQLPVNEMALSSSALCAESSLRDAVSILTFSHLVA